MSSNARGLILTGSCHAGLDHRELMKTSSLELGWFSILSLKQSESFISEPALGAGGICKHAILLCDYLNFSSTMKVPERGKKYLRKYSRPWRAGFGQQINPTEMCLMLYRGPVPSLSCDRCQRNRRTKTISEWLGSVAPTGKA